MSRIGTIATGQTGIFNLDFLPQFILVGDVDQAVQTTNLSVVTGGVQLMSITDAVRIAAVSKFDSGALLQVISTGVDRVAPYINLSTGRVNKQTTLTVGVAATGARDVFAASNSLSTVGRRATEQSLNPSANATFENFEALFFLPTSVLRAQITFDNGFSDEFTVQELGAMYAKYHVAETGGLLSGMVCIDSESGAGNIVSVSIFNGPLAAVTIVKTDFVQL
jgi:hypothetical protein